MKHYRIYTNTGGVTRFTYDMQGLLDTVNQETQFVGRNLVNEGGMVDLNKMAGPDDIDFVVRSIKSSADTLDSFIPKHAKTEEFRVIVFSNKEVTITFSSSGKTARGVLEQAYEHTKNFMVNTMLRLWYEKVLMGGQAATYAVHAEQSVRQLQRVLLHSFIIQQPYGSRYPKVTPMELARPLKSKFLGSYRTADALDEVHDSTYAAGDLCYIEAEDDYMVYTGAAWEAITAIVDGLTAGSKLDAADTTPLPDTADAGDVYFIKRGGSIGEYKDRVYSGDALLCIADNRDTEQKYKNTLENFIVLGPVRKDDDH